MQNISMESLSGSKDDIFECCIIFILFINRKMNRIIESLLIYLHIERLSVFLWEVLDFISYIVKNGPYSSIENIGSLEPRRATTEIGQVQGSSWQIPVDFGIQSQLFRSREWIIWTHFHSYVRTLQFDRHDFPTKR